MKKLIALEEAAIFALVLFVYPALNLSWWWFIGFLLVPDLSMTGYLIDARRGAWFYNLAHHRAVAIAIGASGYYLHNDWIMFTALILFAHATLDRVFGYGLKYESGFRFTHLGEIGHKS
jgi:hypothetical protein